MSSALVDPAAIQRSRLRAQRLTRPRHADVVAAVRWGGAVQAQELAEARWSLVQRTSGQDDAAVQAALDTGSIVRTHALRPTWHLVAREDLAWLARLTAPRVHQLNGSMYRRLGLDPELLARTDTALAWALADGEPRTRAQLGAVLAERGIEATGMRLAYVLMHAELGCRVISGPRRGRQHTYVSADGRLPAPPERSRDEDLAELAVRFLRSHGPAGARDLAWWASLTLTDSRRAIALAGDAVAELLPGMWVAADALDVPKRTGDPRALLLGEYDELVVAHREHRLQAPLAPPGERTRLVLVAGTALGAWRRDVHRGGVTVCVRPFARLAAADRKAVETEVDRFGAALGLAAQLEVLTAP